jgi:hypothetical protein
VGRFVDDLALTIGVERSDLNVVFVLKLSIIALCLDRKHNRKPPQRVLSPDTTSQQWQEIVSSVGENQRRYEQLTFDGKSGVNVISFRTTLSHGCKT